jgi:hypothetical protein
MQQWPLALSGTVRLVGADAGSSISLPGFSCLLNLRFYQRIINTKHQKKYQRGLVFRGGAIKVVMGRHTKEKGCSQWLVQAGIFYITISVPGNAICTLCSAGISKFSTNVCVFVLFGS